MSNATVPAPAAAAAAAASNNNSSLHRRFLSDQDSKAGEKEQTEETNNAQLLAQQQSLLSQRDDNEHNDNCSRPPFSLSQLSSSFPEDDDDVRMTVSSLQQSGALSHVVGPNSLLSQELLDLSQMSSLSTAAAAAAADGADCDADDGLHLLVSPPHDAPTMPTTITTAAAAAASILATTDERMHDDCNVTAIVDHNDNSQFNDNHHTNTVHTMEDGMTVQVTANTDDSSNNNTTLLELTLDTSATQETDCSDTHASNNVTTTTTSTNTSTPLSSLQLSCLVRAAQELESPPPKDKKTSNAAIAAATTTATSNSLESNTNAEQYKGKANNDYDCSSRKRYHHDHPTMPSASTAFRKPPTTRSAGGKRKQRTMSSSATTAMSFKTKANQHKTTARNNKTRAPNRRPKRASSQVASSSVVAYNNNSKQDEQAFKLAQQAADLAAQAIAHPEISKQMLLSMVLVRTNPRSPPSQWPPVGTVIDEGFFWGTYPPLESKLKSYMRAYYDLSIKKCQSKEQQAFNNDMVTMIRTEANKYGWSFSSNFDEKGLRDRVRCYFKTHIQNAKKRLKTMLMNPTKKANTKALIGHLDMIKAYADRKREELNDLRASRRRRLEQEPQQQGAAGVTGTASATVAATLVTAATGPAPAHQELLPPLADGAADRDVHDAVQNVMALGFAHLSQDSYEYSNSSTQEQTVAM